MLCVLPVQLMQWLHKFHVLGCEVQLVRELHRCEHHDRHRFKFIPVQDLGSCEVQVVGNICILLEVPRPVSC